MSINTSALLRDLRQWHADHNETMDFFNCLISVIDHNEHALGDQCKLTLAGLLCQCVDAVQQDKDEQTAEQAWLDKERRTT